MVSPVYLELYKSTIVANANANPNPVTRQNKNLLQALPVGTFLTFKGHKTALERQDSMTRETLPVRTESGDSFKHPKRSRFQKTLLTFEKCSIILRERNVPIKCLTHLKKL